MAKKAHRIFLTEPVLNWRGKAQKSVFLGEEEFRVLKGRAALEGVSARALMTRGPEGGQEAFGQQGGESFKRDFKVRGGEGRVKRAQKGLLPTTSATGYNG